MECDFKIGDSNGRLSIAVLGNVVYSARVPIRIGDLNYGNHLGHDALISILHTVRAEFLRKHELTELDVGGCGIILRDLSIVYAAECFFGDTLDVRLSVGGFTKTSFQIFYLVLKHGTGREVARARLTFVFFDFGKRKPTQGPVGFIKILMGEGIRGDSN